MIKEKQVTQEEIPMLDIFNFACNSALRLSEICGKITWNALDEERKILTISNRKNPKKEVAQTSDFQLSQKSFEILIHQPRGKNNDPTFIFKSSSVGAKW